MKGGFSLIYWVLILGVFYFFLIAPEKKRQKQAQTMLGSLRLGDTVMTRGGILGTIVSMDEDKMVITTGPDEVKITITRFAVASKVEAKSEAVNSEAEAKEEVGFRENESSQAQEIKEED